MADEVRAAAEWVFHRAKTEEDPFRVTLDTEALYSLGLTLFGPDYPEVADLRRNIDEVKRVAQGENVTMGQLVDRLNEFPPQEGMR